MVSSLLFGCIGFFGIFSLLTASIIYPNYFHDYEEAFNAANMCLSLIFGTGFITSIVFLLIYFQERSMKYGIRISLRELVLSLIFTSFYGHYIMVKKLFSESEFIGHERD